MGAASFTAPSYVTDDEEWIEEVVVTGSCIPRTGFDTMLPANVINSEFMARRGYTNIADELNEVKYRANTAINSGLQGLLVDLATL